MINTVLQTIERFESSPAFGAVQLPASIFDNDLSDSIIVTDTEEDTSDDSDEYKDTQEQGPKVVNNQTYQALIKQTLKDKIRIRRESEGVKEITTLFEPAKIYELTPEEEVKNEVRKQRNRCSATKSRLKRIAREKKLEEDARALEHTHAERTSEVNALKKIKLLFATLLKRHLPTCPKLAAARNPKGHIPLQNTAHNANVGATTRCMTFQTTCGTNSPSSLQTQLPLTSNICTTLRNEEPQSMQSSHQSHLKRKATDELNGQPFKKPFVWNQTPLTHSISLPIDTAVQTCTNKNICEIWAKNIGTATSEFDTSSPIQSVSMATRVDIQCDTTNENVLRELPGTSDSIMLPFSSTARNNNLGRSTSSPEIECGVRGENEHSVNTNVTRQQKINHIKQHLFDDFPLNSPQSS